MWPPTYTTISTTTTRREPAGVWWAAQECVLCASGCRGSQPHSSGLQMTAISPNLTLERWWRCASSPCFGPPPRPYSSASLLCAYDTCIPNTILIQKNRVSVAQLTKPSSHSQRIFHKSMLCPEWLMSNSDFVIYGYHLSEPSLEFRKEKWELKGKS